MNHLSPALSATRIILAYSVAVTADFLQLPLNCALATGIFFVPGESANMLVDIIAMMLTSLILGFHWVLLPSFVLETIPFLDVAPTWTLAVTYVIWERQKQATGPSAPPIIADVQSLSVAGPTPSLVPGEPQTIRRDGPAD